MQAKNEKTLARVTTLERFQCSTFEVVGTTSSCQMDFTSLPTNGQPNNPTVTVQTAGGFAAKLAELAVSDAGVLAIGVDDTVRCPICGDDHLHIVGTGAESDGTMIFVSNDGIQIIHGLPRRHRGSAAITVYGCEVGHHLSAEVTRFKKGESTRQWYRLPGNDTLLAAAGELWRD
jgi:hypothetical protein